MSDLLLLLFLFSLLAVPVFLIRPQLLKRLLKLDWSRKRILGVFSGLTFLFFILFGMSLPDSETNQSDEKAETIVTDSQEATQSAIESEIEAKEEELFLVIRVIDGDTIELENRDRVRYIGIDAPESNECYEQEATDKNKELVLNKKVKLEKDVSEIDRYDRLLRYVYVDGLLVNESLVLEGFAEAKNYPPDDKYREKLSQVENEAREEKRGLWGEVCNPEPTLVPTSTVIPSSTSDMPVQQKTIIQPTSEPMGVQTSGCKYSCSGPDRDCADFSTHAEAQAFFNCCGFTATNDPMRLDSVKVGDGVACESLP